ncbi:hypothetical protein ACG0Z5_10870 [Scandinavium sp. M-37]|uniref:hypothetical protein n=1 Tax=Scandinavium sp. M-37 TaxID=3373077 RepID=UPI0037450FEB
MKERGMIFNGEMVRALLDGRKMQTRRPIKPQPELTERSGFSWKNRVYGSGSTDRETNRNFAHIACPHGKPGDRIWVRETFSIVPDHDEPAGSAAVLYAADGTGPYGKWRPSIHMPREYSRILLEISNVGVQRIQSISQNDAAREGLIRLPATGRYCLNQGDQYFGGASHDAREVFSWLWSDIYGEENWNANPWVWVIEFKRVEEGAV